MLEAATESMSFTVQIAEESVAKTSIEGSRDDIPIAPLVVFFRKSSLAEGNASNLLMKFIILETNLRNLRRFAQ